MINREESQKLVERILSFSKFPECSVVVTESEAAQVRFANNGITTAGLTRERSIVISSTKEQRTGTTRITDTDEAAIRSAMERSEELAGIAPPNAESTEPLGPQTYPKVPSPDEETTNARTSVMIPHVKAVVDAAKARKFISAGFFTRETSHNAFGNKAGNFGHHVSASVNMSVTVRNAAGTSSGWASQPASRISQIQGVQLGEIAIGKCERWKEPKKLDPGKYTVVLEPAAVADLMGFFGFSMAARAAEEGRSFLSKRGGGTLLGEKHFHESVTLLSDPFDPRHPGQPWTQGGLPNNRMIWIENGVVKNLAYDRYWAQKTSKPPTPAPSSLRLKGGEGTLEQLITKVERGLLITRFWYIRPTNFQTLQLTGLTRDGLFIIEDGKVAGAAMNFRFNESPVRMLQNVKAMGKEVLAKSGEGFEIIAPPLVAGDFNFTSISDAV